MPVDGIGRVAPEAIITAFVNGVPLRKIACAHNMKEAELRRILESHSVYCFGRIEGFMVQQKMTIERAQIIADLLNDGGEEEAALAIYYCAALAQRYRKRTRDLLLACGEKRSSKRAEVAAQVQLEANADDD